MEFGSLPWWPTVDVFEVVIVLALLVGVPAAAYNLRESWAEKEWAIDDPDASIRRLGLNRWENAQSLFFAMLTVAVVTGSSLLVPSPAMAVPAVTTFAELLNAVQDILNAVVQRVGLALVVVFLTRKCVNDAIWRRDVDRRRRATHAAFHPGGVPVVEAPAVVVSPPGARAPAEGASG